jgi:hypothetical protein
MFTNIRNETVRQRYPDNLPGTILEINVEDAKGLNVTNGDLVEVECKDIHMGGSGSFRAVVSIQSEFLPSGMVFGIFSYPVSNKRLEGFPYRSFLSSGYANNITTGYVDPINPIAAVKFARGTIRKLEGRYSSPAYLGPSYSPRNRAFPIQMVEDEKKSLDWKMRELIVQKGVPRVRLHAEIDRGIADAILDPEIFMDNLTHDRAFREGFKGVLSAGLMEWRGRDGTLYDSWSQKELQLALNWIAQVESKRRRTSRTQAARQCQTRWHSESSGFILPSESPALAMQTAALRKVSLSDRKHLAFLRTGMWTASSLTISNSMEESGPKRRAFESGNTAWRMESSCRVGRYL